jgi:hypothetical protein
MVPMLTTASTVTCPHAGQAVLVTSNTLSQIDGAPVLLQSDVHPIAGCTFAPGGVPTPCLIIQWVTGSLLMRIYGIPVLLQTSVGICYNAAQVPQGVAIVVQTQQKGRAI